MESAPFIISNLWTGTYALMVSIPVHSVCIAFLLPAESVDPKLLFHFEDSCLLVDKVPRADQINFRVKMEALS